MQQFNCPGPYLVVAPMSTIRNWFNEFKRFAPACPVLLHYGTQQLRRDAWKRAKCGSDGATFKATTVITSYETLISDQALLSNVEWCYLIVDEAHRLKNPKCTLLKALTKLNVDSKLLLTGTPLQNNLAELWSLLNFLVPLIFSSCEVFTQLFNLDKLAEHFGQREGQSFVSILHKTLAPFLLRRTKRDVALSMPGKRELILYAPSTPAQVDSHRELALQCKFWKTEREKEQQRLSNKRRSKKHDHLDKNLLLLNRSDRRKPRTATTCYSDDDDAEVCTSDNMMIEMRKSCNHPYLINYPLDLAGGYLVDESLVAVSGPIVEPHGTELFDTKFWVGTPAAAHARCHRAPPTPSVA